VIVPALFSFPCDDVWWCTTDDGHLTVSGCPEKQNQQLSWKFTSVHFEGKKYELQK
jgi:hypothetical protein